MSVHRFVVVVGIDFSPEADHCIDRALELAGGREGSQVHVVHVEQDGASASAPMHHALGADATVDRVQRHVCQRMHRMPAGLHDLAKFIASECQPTPLAIGTTGDTESATGCSVRLQDSVVTGCRLSFVELHRPLNSGELDDHHW